MSTDRPEEGSVRCHLHPDRPAADGCGLCGVPLCDLCRSSPACPGCGSALPQGGRLEAPEPPQGTFGAALDRAWEGFKHAWLELSALVLAAWLLAMVLGAASSFLTLAVAPTPTADAPPWTPMVWSTGLNLLYQLVGVALFGSLALYAADVLQGAPTRRGWMLYPWRRLPALAAFPILYLLVFVPMSALAFAFYPLPEDPALWDPSTLDVARFVGTLGAASAGMFGLLFVTLPLFVFGTLEVLYAGAPLKQALANAWRMGRGRRWLTLGTVLFASLIQFAGMLALCVGVLPGTALALLLVVALYLEVRGRSGIAPFDEPVEGVAQDAPPPALA